jgi:hypothetical protein
MMRAVIVAAALLALGAGGASAQSQWYPPFQGRCGACANCVAQQAQARRAEPRVQRLLAETRHRGGTPEAAHTLFSTRDYQSLLRDSKRACGCPRGC